MSHFGRSGPPDIRDTFSLLVLNISFRRNVDGRNIMVQFAKYGPNAEPIASPARHSASPRKSPPPRRSSTPEKHTNGKDSPPSQSVSPSPKRRSVSPSPKRAGSRSPGSDIKKNKNLMLGVSYRSGDAEEQSSHEIAEG
ncbi:hypothetical protein HU200_013166 [Digitaria exilis]|uniref:Uncharacterized protein n=1 Tax=Digitaria exilis TaxID=1010633 RepID=A0A835KJV3_9POAL|nr:hypothetical protein HU200_013166 [Digitaria exilis]